MSKTIVKGRFSHTTRGVYTLLRTCADVLWRRARGRPLVAEWSIPFEIATLFYRHQFNHAFSLRDIVAGRAYFDAVYSTLGVQWPVTVTPVGLASNEPKGDWIRPNAPIKADTPTVLYLHGGGYAFYGEVSREFAKLLSHRLQMPLFAPDYRLTPEHPHPAQLKDALAAYRHLLAQGIASDKIVIIGDSAGGHLALMTLAQLSRHGLPQPALVIGLSPWTDTGLRGASQFGNDVYDMVQGYQTVQYSEWLKAGTSCTDRDVSPIHENYQNTAPVYLQAGGKEILVDMIRDFAHALAAQGAQVMLDVWPHMTHEFHAWGDTLPESRAALDRIQAAMAWSQDPQASPFEATPVTELAHMGPF